GRPRCLLSPRGVRLPLWWRISARSNPALISLATIDRAIPPPRAQPGGVLVISYPPSSPCIPQTLLYRARSGDQDAWQVLFDACYPKIVCVVRKRLSRPMRNLYDSTDIANEVMKSLAAKFNHFDFSSIDGLRAFLIRAAEQKVVDGYRRGHAQKRDIGR